jgi:hypothetical protein
MLKRGQSDFEWFQNRTRKLHSDLVNEYPSMATLNPEPAAPEERAEYGLPPKSYATATKEPFEKQQQENGNAFHINGDLKESKKSQIKADVKGNEQQLDEQKVLFEEHTNGDGEILTSVKPDPEYEKSLKHDKEAAPRDQRKSSKNTNKRQDTPKSQLKDDLSSGREAGAGWEKSA